MTRVICHQTECVFWDNMLCTAERIELDPDQGCLTMEELEEIILDGDDWEDEEDEFDDDDWENEDFFDEDEIETPFGLIFISRNKKLD